MMPRLCQLTRFLDRELKPETFRDSAHNGLQVENTGNIRNLCCGVDASMAFFEAAHARKANLLICHHGISWGDSLARITELNYRRLHYLLTHNMALYACHLPLDAHPVHGNNARIARALGLRATRPFGDYHGQAIGVIGRLRTAMSHADFKARASGVFTGGIPNSLDFGNDRIQTVAVVSGGASDMVAEAGRAGADLFITGEPTLAAYAVAEEYAIHVWFAGHYATETFGVRALGDLLASHFKVHAEFLDLGIPY